MKKIVLFAILAALVVYGIFSFLPQKQAPGPVTQTTSNVDQGQVTDQTVSEGRDENAPAYDEKPASQVYASADEAYDAILKGAKEYDDLILERFTQPGADCTWCTELYGKLTEKMLGADSSEDEKSFIGEILAISGRPENVATLVQAVKDSGETDAADIYAESLELTIGGDDVVALLKEHLTSDNELLQESVVAAITNQGSKLAAETLYQHTVEKGDADGYYALGIGLGEFIPEEDALPYLSELVEKRDQYSHLAVKSLLNQGAEGLKYVLEDLGSSPDPEADRKLLVDAVDHMMYDEETIGILRRCRDANSSALAKEFCGQTLTELEQEEADLQKLDKELDEEK